MMRLYVDGSPCDIATEPTIPIAFDAASLTRSEGQREGRTVELELPATPTNDALFGASRDVHAVERFNASHHTARFELRGVTLFDGTIYLLATRVGRGCAGGYLVRITDGGATWIRRAVHETLDKADIPVSVVLSVAGIEENLHDEDGAVRLLPIHRTRDEVASDDVLRLTQRVPLPDDYYPFVSVSRMVEDLFKRSGYELCSRFCEGELFRSLYMSGSYSASTSVSQRERCDFLARRKASVTASADALGRVYASPAVSSCSLGNIVDTANPEAIDNEGRTMSDTFSTGGSFVVDDDGFACFVPPTAVHAGLLYHLDYTTDYRIISRERLQGFDVVEATPDMRVAFELINRFEDRRAAAAAMTSYRVMVFDYEAGDEFRLLVDDVQVGEFSSRSALLTTPSGVAGATKLLWRNVAQGEEGWLLCAKDWAMYDGHVGETGRVDVELDLRLPPQELSAGERLRLDKIIFGGADGGMSLTLGCGTSVRPYFSTAPGYGAQLGWGDVVSHDVRFIDLLDALGRMFNLVFYTDEAARRVYIEPMEQFYSSEVVDWSDKIDLAQPVELSDAAIDGPQRYRFAYLAADTASARFNRENDTTLGEWSFHIPLYGTSESERRMTVELFTTTLNATGLCATAPSASIMQVDEPASQLSGVELSLTPRIVCYKGLQQLPAGERWGTGDEEYPLALFLGGKQGVNLCFEEREGVEGLHQYYDERLGRERDRQRLRVSLRLQPIDVQRLFSADGVAPSLRTTFRLKINGESALYRLERMAGYSTAEPSTECSFIRIGEDAL